MKALAYAAAGLFLPLFPLSMGFTLLFSRVPAALPRAVLLLAWPQIGLTLVPASAPPASGWPAALALGTAGLYAFRAVGLREVGQWTAYLATSSWALLWIALFDHADPGTLRLYGVGFSVPLVLLTLLGARLDRCFGAAYIGLYGGLAQTLPRMSGVLVSVILAVVASPLTPGFFALLATIMAATPAAPAMALGVAVVWLLWTWAGVRLLQGLVVGPGNGDEAPDLSLGVTWAYAAALAGLLAGGLYVTGEML